MLIKNKLLEIVKAGLCIGCGACYIMCPHNAINLKVSSNGTYSPVINLDKCVNCKLCERVCPAINPQRIKVKGLGNFIRCYIGYSTELEIRWRASSGGVATTILLSLLEEGLISGAIVVKSDSRDPLKPVMTIARSREEIIEAMGSKYCPVRPTFKITDMLSMNGKIAVVALPCHIWVFKNLEKLDKRLKDKILVYLGLLCGKCPNFYATVYFIRKNAGVNEEDVAMIRYRGEGWPGKISVITKSGCIRVFELKKWISFSYYPHFIPLRCVFCYDIANQLADISLGDAWGLSHDNVGASLIITRTPVGESIIKHLSTIRKLVVKEVDPEQVIQGQGIDKKVKNALIRAYIWQNVFHQSTPIKLRHPPNFSLKGWVLNLGYCFWLYAAQDKLMRIIMSNLTPLISRIVEWLR